MIIVEGTDLVGKTDVCHRLLKDKRLSGHIYAHLDRPGDGFHDYWGYIDRMSPNVIQDRFHMSAVAYDYARNKDECHIAPETYRVIDARLRLLGGFTIVITADESLITDRFKIHKDRELYELPVILQANDWFRDAGSDDKGLAWSYSPDVDAHFRCTVKHPFASDYWLFDMVTIYLQRRARLLALSRQDYRWHL